MKLKLLLLALSASTLFFLNAQAEGGKGNSSKGEGRNPAKMFEKLDSDGNGAISLAEVQAEERAKRMAENFSTIDTNGDGELTPEELKAHKETRRKQQAEGKGPQKAKGKGGMKMLDTDESGSISRQEADKAERISEKFDDIDTDGNGELSGVEIRDHMQALKSKPSQSKSI